MSSPCCDSGVAVQIRVAKAACAHLKFIGGDPPARLEYARTCLGTVTPRGKYYVNGVDDVYQGDD
jgi:hypothetical protein